MRRLLAILCVLWAVPVAAQQQTGTVERVVEMYHQPEHTVIRRWFVVLPDGTYVRIKGVHGLKGGERVRVERTKIKNKPRKEPAITPAEIDAADLVPVPEVRGLVGSFGPVVRPLDVIRVRWGTSGSIESLATTQARALAVQAQYARMSFTLFQWDPVVVHADVVISVPTSSYCNYASVVSDGIAAASARGDTFANGQVYTVMQQYQACGWAGISGSGQPTGNGGSGSMAHELGHNLGIDHAGAESAVGGVRSLADQYGDRDDPMGDYNCDPSFCGFNAAHLTYLGWLSPQRVTASGDYTISDLNTTASALAYVDTRGVAFYVEARLRRGASVMAVRVVYGTLFTGVADLDPVTSARDYELDQGQSYILLPDGAVVTGGARSGKTAIVHVTLPGGTPPPPLLCVTGVSVTTAVDPSCVSGVTIQ